MEKEKEEEEGASGRQEDGGRGVRGMVVDEESERQEHVAYL